MEYLTLTVHEFRKNMKAALDTALEGNIVIIDRMGQRFSLTHLPRGIELHHAKVDNKVFVANGVDPVKKNDLATPKIDTIEPMPHHKDDPVPDPFSGEMACCPNPRKRCQHWQYDNEKLKWVNSLSGREVELENE